MARLDDIGASVRGLPTSALTWPDTLANTGRRFLTQASREIAGSSISWLASSAALPKVVDPKLHVAGNATATAANVVANSELVRMGVVAHLVDGVFFALTAMALYLLLNHVQRNAARSMVLFVVLAGSAIDLPQRRLPL